jgi:hypothetical protein
MCPLLDRSKLDAFMRAMGEQAGGPGRVGHRHDLSDVLALVKLGKVNPVRLQELFREIRGSLLRFPAIDPEDFASKVAAFVMATRGVFELHILGPA